MEQKLISVGPRPTVMVGSVPGDLQITGWERPEVMAKTDGDLLEVNQNGEVVTISSDGDLIVYAPRESSLKIRDVSRDADLRGVGGSIELGSVGGDLQVRNTGPVRVTSVSRDLSVRAVQGDFQSENVGDDASLRQVYGSASIGNVGSDLLLNDVRGNVSAMVGADAVMYLQPGAGATCHVQAGSDVLLRLPPDADAELDLQGGSMESIRVDFPGINALEQGMTRRLTLGAGTSKISLIAGDDLIVTTHMDEWKSMAEFNPGPGDEFSPGSIFPELEIDIHKRVAQGVEQSARRAIEHSARTAERAQRRVELAMRRAEDKMRAAERRSMHFGVSLGRSLGGERPVVPPTPPGDPVSDEERLAILRMLQGKKITAAEAERLLSALEGK